MAINFLQALMSPGPGLNGSDVSAPGANPSPYASAPVASPQAPQNLLEGIPGYGDTPPPPNAMQNLNMQPGVTPNAAPQPDSAAPAAPRARRSILDTVGRLADVFAKVGGAEALYQPTLDRREDRALALGDHARTVDLDKLKLATAQNTLDDAGRARITQAVRGTQALLAANPSADITKIFPLFAARAGVPADQAAALAGQIAANPGMLDGLAGFDDSGDKYSGSVVYGRDANGNVVAYQPNLKGGKARTVLPDGVTAADRALVVNNGGETNIVDPRTGQPLNTIGNTAKPDTAANNQTRRDIAAGNNRTAVTIAGMPARAKPTTADKPKGDAATAGRAKQATDLLDELDRTYTSLDKVGAAIKPGASIVNNVIARVRSSGAGQFVEGAVGTKAQTYRDRINSIRPALMQSLAKATGMTGKQLDSNADVKLFMQTVTDPTKSLTANRQAISGLRRFLAENTASGRPAPTPAPARGTRALPPRIQRSGGAPAPKRVAVGKPTVSNW
ncbi:MAG: hypothetical protein H0X34_07205 [Chthoniobacterales bacterium]|nr:hypothetical protein [Chthoniobacterales bacterium]